MPAQAPGFWQRRGLPAWSLFPLSLIFAGLAGLRRRLFALGVMKVRRLPAPVIVVGNIAVGGSGKTPVVIWLAEALRARGWRPGIISRGYGGQVDGPAEVSADGDASRFGDEPVLMAARTGCPVFVGRDRPAAGEALLAAHPAVDVLIADDGLQHYRLARDLEIVVVDEATLGNTLHLPAGPLREGLDRLGEADLILSHGGFSVDLQARLRGVSVFSMTLSGEAFERIDRRQEKALAGDFQGRGIHAMAGIGRPERFFRQLENLGLRFERRPFPDHHAFVPADLAIPDGDVLLMTEKDAVKCRSFAPPDSWVWPVRALVAPGAVELIVEKLDGPPTA